MSVLSMVEAKLPPGFRFHPRDDELVCDYLAPKVGKKDAGRSLLLLPGLSEAMVDVDLNKCEPWDLPEAACVGGKEWYFFSIKDRKYATGQRTNRATESGYWKATGKDRRISRKGKLVGMRKTLVFYRGRAPKGKKTEWVMHEYRIQSKDDSSQLTTKEDWVLCRVFSKEKGGGATPKPKAFTNYPGANRDTAYTATYLPPLTDSHIASSGSQFVVPEASTMDNNLGFGLIEQVPCFSSFNNNNSGGSSSTSTTLSASNCTPAATVMINNTMGDQWLDHPAQYESSFLKVLGQLSKPNFSEGYENHIINGTWNPF